MLREMQEWQIYRGIITRCENPRSKSFARYGARGITMCDEWRKDFWSFYNHIGPRPSKSHSVDRIDTLKGYEPGNVRWASVLTQTNNRKNTRFVDIDGEKIPLGLAVRRFGSVVHIECAWVRIKTGWDVRRALTEPRHFISGNSKELRRVAG